jgi:pantoate--beta-alanine ligase
MLLFKTVDGLHHYLEEERSKGKIVGFVPTMGALHEGHLSLIRQSRREADLTVCSIFVNPTQFNEQNDLAAYPRAEADDLALLAQENCEVVFLPSVEEVYPPGLDTSVDMDFGTLDQEMEGAHRPGHFAGMVQVVNRLLEIVEPHRLYMGQKDFQQFAIVQEMLRQQNSPVRIVRCPIVREPHGLAMSSRNARLTPDQRERARLIHDVLEEMNLRLRTSEVGDVKDWAMEQLNAPADFEVDYVEIADGYSLQAVEQAVPGNLVIACVAVRVGEVRLIDNLILQES